MDCCSVKLSAMNPNDRPAVPYTAMMSTHSDRLWASLRSLGLLLIVLPYFLVMATGVVVTSLLGMRRTWGWWFARVFCRNVLKVSGVTFNVSGLENVPTSGGFVLVANHQSHFDGLLLISVFPRLLQAVAKRELYYFLPLGLAFWAIGFVPVHRRNPKKASHSVHSGTQVLLDGGALMVFPEGTRTDAAQVYPFKTGAARMAIEAGVPILPVGIAGTEAILRAHSWVVRPGRVGLEIGAPLPTLGTNFGDRHAVTLQAQKHVQQLRASARDALV